jgi:hypothetical protein
VVTGAKIRGERDNGICQGRSPFQTSVAKEGTRAPYNNPSAIRWKLPCKHNVSEWLR